MASEFLGCIAFSARSDRAANIAPDAPKRHIFTRTLIGRLRRVKLRSVALSSGDCLVTALPTGATGRIPAVNFVTRLSADPSVSNGSIRPHVMDCRKKSVILYTRRGIILSPLVFPRLSSCGKRSVVIAGNGALLKTSSGKKITTVVTTVGCLGSRPRVRRNGVHMKFAPSRRVKTKTSCFSIRGFNYR